MSMSKTKNCVTSPLIMYLGTDNLLYGENTNLGCTLNYTFGNFEFWKTLYRPSENSVMRNPYSYMQFNTISCSYCMDKFSTAGHDKNLNTCLNMSTIKPKKCTSNNCPMGFTCTINGLCQKN